MTEQDRINEVRGRALDAGRDATDAQLLQYRADELRVASDILTEAILDVAKIVADNPLDAEGHASTLQKLFAVLDSLDTAAWSIDRSSGDILAAQAEEVDA